MDLPSGEFVGLVNGSPVGQTGTLSVIPILSHDTKQSTPWDLIANGLLVL
jgi:hypothetical protein